MIISNDPILNEQNDLFKINFEKNKNLASFIDETSLINICNNLSFYYSKFSFDCVKNGLFTSIIKRLYDNENKNKSSYLTLLLNLMIDNKEIISFLFKIDFFSKFKPIDQKFVTTNLYINYFLIVFEIIKTKNTINLKTCFDNFNNIISILLTSNEVFELFELDEFFICCEIYTSDKYNSNKFLEENYFSDFVNFFFKKNIYNFKKCDEILTIFCRILVKVANELPFLKKIIDFKKKVIFTKVNEKLDITHDQLTCFDLISFLKDLSETELYKNNFKIKEYVLEIISTICGNGFYLSSRILSDFNDIIFKQIYTTDLKKNYLLDLIFLHTIKNILDVSKVKQSSFPNQINFVNTTDNMEMETEFDENIVDNNFYYYYYEKNVIYICNMKIQETNILQFIFSIISKYNENSDNADVLIGGLKAVRMFIKDFILKKYDFLKVILENYKLIINLSLLDNSDLKNNVRKFLNYLKNFLQLNKKNNFNINENDIEHCIDSILNFEKNFKIF